MLNALRDFLKNLGHEDVPARHFDDGDIRLALAALLTHAMAIDGVIDDNEQAKMRHLLQAEFDISGEDLDILIEEASEADSEAVDLYGFTSVLKRGMEKDQRVRVVEHLWEIVYADGEVHEFEDNLVWRIAELLGVERTERIGKKSQVEARTKS